MGKLLILIVVVIVVLAVWIISTYNKLVSAREMIKNSKGQIAAQIESRWDALRSLIDATKQYAAHEAQTLAEVTRARTAVSSSSSIEQFKKDNAQFEMAMGRINALAESYPDLKASSLYLKTMDNITQFENNVRHSRMVYNDSVTKLNRMIQMFPGVIVANMASVTAEEYFTETESKREMPTW